MERILILGMGGHAKSIVDSIERENKYEIAGYVINASEDSACVEKYPVLGCDDNLQELFLSGIHNAVVGVGFLGDGDLRNQLYRKLKDIGYELPAICDPSAIIASGVSIGEGTFIGKGAILNADTNIGKMCIVNTGAIIEHDCAIGDFSHVSVGAVLCGGVNVGMNTFVGANATVVQERSIGDRTIIGAGAVVVRDVEEKCTIVGNPGRIIKRC